MRLPFGWSAGLRGAGAACAAAWAVSLFVAAYLVRPGADAAHLFSYVVYAAGSLICHQQPERSFHLWTVQLPVCARCVGIYLGAAISAVAFLVRPVGSQQAAWGWPIASPRLVLALGALPSVLTLVYEWTTGDAPANWMRVSAGVPLGASIAALIGSLR